MNVHSHFGMRRPDQSTCSCTRLDFRACSKSLRKLSVYDFHGFMDLLLSSASTFFMPTSCSSGLFYIGVSFGRGFWPALRLRKEKLGKEKKKRRSADSSPSSLRILLRLQPHSLAPNYLAERKEKKEEEDAKGTLLPSSFAAGRHTHPQRPIFRSLTFCSRKKTSFSLDGYGRA